MVTTILILGATIFFGRILYGLSAGIGPPTAFSPKFVNMGPIISSVTDVSFFAHFTSSFPFSKSVSKDFALYILSAIFLHSGQTQSPSKMEIKQIMLKSGKRTQLINDNNPNKSILMIPLLFTNANKFQPPCSSMGSRLIHLPSCGLR